MTVLVTNATIQHKTLTPRSHPANMIFEQTNTTTVFSNKSEELLREDNGSGRGASFQCSNIFSIFAVLVFLFALVDFIMGMDGRRRRRRDVSGCNLEEPLLEGDNLEDPLRREASLAVALLWRGNLLSNSHHMDRNTFLDPQTAYNTYNNEKMRRRFGGGRGRREEVDCDATVRCKAAKSAASLGRSLFLISLLGSFS